ncbi:helix-turn-helix domain-containing protein [Pseudodonghicola flavimaris]|uniref:Helix-turn-helix domain-containing protein n=1 Tax=Pseudodonghicola flavimaris TaxID=3050036 RepID=A0ABT7F2I1_9RHOB|nr:helix-turn-helix domain-containing protein [Pseudodonghicola flavimaris]MDK3018819.1 helix-turn-helix domain-containing protein [Pseudodonghicola flavimaris]
MTVYKAVRALERGLTILEAVNEKDGMRTQEVADYCGLSRPTVFRLLETLEAQGFVQQSKSDGAWHPTLRCNLLSCGYLDKAWVGQLAMPEMVRLGSQILWPIDLVTLAEDSMQVRQSTHKFSPFSFDVSMIGKKIPLLLTAGGRAYFSYCPEEEREEILDILRRTGQPDHNLAHDPRFLAKIIALTRERGYGFRAEEFRPKTVSISMPIMKHGRPVACLTVSALKSALSLEELARKFSRKLRQTCDRIEELIARYPD